MAPRTTDRDRLADAAIAELERRRAAAPAAGAYEITGPWLAANGSGLRYTVHRILDGRMMAAAIVTRSIGAAERQAKALRTTDARQHPDRAGWPIVRTP